MDIESLVFISGLVVGAVCILSAAAMFLLPTWFPGNKPKQQRWCIGVTFGSLIIFILLACIYFRLKDSGNSKEISPISGEINIPTSLIVETPELTVTITQILSAYPTQTSSSYPTPTPNSVNTPTPQLTPILTYTCASKNFAVVSSRQGYSKAIRLYSYDHFVEQQSNQTYESLMVENGSVKLGTCIDLDRISTNGKWVRLSINQCKDFGFNCFDPSWLVNNYLWIKSIFITPNPNSNLLEIEDPYITPVIPN